MEIVKSDNGSNYVYEQGTRFISLVPDALADCIKGNGNDSYYLKKLDYLIEHRLLSPDNSLRPEYCLLEEQDLKEQIFNTHQIVFEVTDRCNLRCHYCGYGELYDNYDKRMDRDCLLCE